MRHEVKMESGTQLRSTESPTQDRNIYHILLIRIFILSYFIGKLHLLMSDAGPHLLMRDAGPKRVSPLSAFQIIETKEGGMMVITTTRITQIHDIVNTWQDGPESVEEILGAKARGWEKSLRKHRKNIMKYRATHPLQHVVTISVEAKTSVC